MDDFYIIYSDKFLSTPSARRATCFRCCGQRSDSISIHALREEGDLPSARTAQLWGNFYPRPPRGGRRASPHPERRRRHISIHALREEGDVTRYSLSPR